MNHFGYLQKSAMGAACEERGIKMMADCVVCPKPRRLTDQFRPSRLALSHQSETGDSKAGAELLDLILAKRDCDGEKPAYQVASSPPFYCGSPPSRVSNPVIQDAQFGSDRITPLFAAPPSPSSSSSHKGGGFARVKFGHIPAAVRIEGFDCLSRDRQNCSISAVA